MMKFSSRHRHQKVEFEEAFTESLGGIEPDVREMPVGKGPFLILGTAILSLILLVAIRTLWIGVPFGGFWNARANSNMRQMSRTPSPRGPIIDRDGTVVAQNKSVFSAVLDIREFLRDERARDTALKTASAVLGIDPQDLLAAVAERNAQQFTDPIILSPSLTQDQIVSLRSANLPTISVVSSYERQYPEGAVYSSFIGYTGMVTAEDLAKSPDLTSRDMIGKMGIEAFYDDRLRGIAGVYEKVHDAKGRVIGEQEKMPGKTGDTLTLTIDAGLQKYFYTRLGDQLSRLGRTAGAGIALNPKTGEVLALINFPTFDNNIFVHSGSNDEKKKLLTSPSRPLFNRAIGGLYTPGSTIKPLVGVASLANNILAPTRTIFSPGYLDIPNPYNPDKPTRYVDWRYQGDVDLYRALAYSSNVYFYTVGGGAGPVKGLGISTLREWWNKFGLGNSTGIDMPGEAKGFLPSAQWKEKQTGKPWLLGDTYNVSIGQGDLLTTPLQIANYVGAIANGGRLMRPFVASSFATSTVIADLTQYASQIKEVQKGMREAVTNPRGTAYMLHDLPFPASGKTGSAQVKNNTQENAFFVGYAPSDDPQIVILILIENSKEGSLNAVPVARDIFDWYGIYRLKSSAEK